VIHIDRNNLTSPEVEDPRLKILVEGLLKEKSFQDFEKYKSYFKKELEGLINHYKSKCGYCESKIDKGSTYPILDHYRPRAKLRDDKSHPGYYWLLYEWTNLVPVCSRCNTAKSNRFPIDISKGKRANGPPMENGCLDMNACRVDSKILLDEFPLVLHPEVDEPEKHIIFLSAGRIKHLTLKGKTTVEVCNLNRGDLIAKRKGLIDKFF
jgi:5-methylcytosine-specific restriction endonuclease McrA